MPCFREKRSRTSQRGVFGLVMLWEGRPWIVILSDDGSKVVTTYPTDERTVTNRRGGGRWIFPSS